MSHYTIVLLGAGRVAQHLGPALAQAGHAVLHVWSRTQASAGAVAATIPGATAGTDLRALPPADLYLLAVPDGAVPQVLAAAGFAPGAVVAHTAGALPLSVFAARAQVRGGVLYPLQTFSPGRAIEWRTVPLCLEATTAPDLELLRTVAASLSADVRLVNSAQRLQLHVAAVWACNFPNHLLGISRALLAEAGLPWPLLHPLIRETLDKALAEPPFAVQTGPAVRHDAATLARHEAALAGKPAWQALYKDLTVSIQQASGAATPNNEGVV
ncbi:putative short-subunit dehydrogenase-like oxidoreductase (DUF2520 family) [Hymenobacter luteus]|uniref:Short-subunit dehydrogenase-like oxidoreductase (DUF2520 family) n=2 Tax=Hymenobacter TaxID=89966 RepID=A0ABR6K134_9BACT|nr:MULTISPECIES: Rossmann-like and DUF2520 domain-containing protein [Hymenobacter]MBB4602798.1 putative short-subunit dehydrogenase-like oxidoreductase (DUF2520 family) [Hymenobacter latericoloratus]MBB6060689.1 putative short-subunit dehydrogenase-like oxidoreductase (DUF2520 family) [Hymenobacter luteus]